MNNLEMFLKELTELTKKYKLTICGCGCCGSPSIDDENKTIGGNLDWNYEKEKYEIDNG
jgi:hypothetical protein